MCRALEDRQEIMLSKIKHVAALALSLVALSTQVSAHDAAELSGDGSWLQLSSRSLLHGTKGQARIVVRRGTGYTSLEAPYEVIGAGGSGGSIKLRTSCGPMSFVFTVPTVASSGPRLFDPDVERLGKKAGVPLCGLGNRINAGWHLVARESSE